MYWSFFFCQLRISVWSLVSKSVSYIKYPKFANAGKVTVQLCI